MHDFSQRLSQLFPSLTSSSLLRDVQQTAQPAQLPAGAAVCHLGQQCTHLALVLSGNARIYQLAESGREITLYRVGAGEVCILTASCIMSQQNFPAMALSETAIDALLVPAGKVDEWMVKHPQWRHLIWTLMANRLSNVLCLLEEVTFRRMDQRISAYLVQKSTIQADPVLALTHQVIADDLGTSREVVSRILKDLEHEGLLSLSRGKITIDPVRLKSSIEQCD